MPVALVTDSNSQLPAVLRDRYGVTIVPIPVVVDGTEYLEGVDLDADGFYELFGDGTPDVTTSQPSPGAFIEVYEAAMATGHDEIISIHVSAAMSGTMNSARIAAEMVDATVHLVDSRTMSFGVSCCLWRAADVLASGGAVSEAVAAAESLAADLYSVTALGAADLLNRSGRVLVDQSNDGVHVYRAGPDGAFESVGLGSTVDEVSDLMATTMHRDGEPIRIALGIADETAMPYYEGLEKRLKARDDVTEIVRYRIGPSVGAFTGLGCAGGFWYPG